MCLSAPAMLKYCLVPNNSYNIPIRSMMSGSIPMAKRRKGSHATEPLHPPPQDHDGHRNPSDVPMRQPRTMPVMMATTAKSPSLVVSPDSNHVPIVVPPRPWRSPDPAGPPGHVPVVVPHRAHITITRPSGFNEGNTSSISYQYQHDQQTQQGSNALNTAGNSTGVPHQEGPTLNSDTVAAIGDYVAMMSRAPFDNTNTHSDAMQGQEPCCLCDGNTGCTRYCNVEYEPGKFATVCLLCMQLEMLVHIARSDTLLPQECEMMIHNCNGTLITLGRAPV